MKIVSKLKIIVHGKPHISLCILGTNLTHASDHLLSLCSFFKNILKMSAICYNASERERNGLFC